MASWKKDNLFLFATLRSHKHCVPLSALQACSKGFFRCRAKEVEILLLIHLLSIFLKTSRLMSRCSRGTMVRLTFRLLFWQHKLLDDLLIYGTIIDNYSNISLNSLINTERQTQLLQEDGEGLLTHCGLSALWSNTNQKVKYLKNKVKLLFTQTLFIILYCIIKGHIFNLTETSNKMCVCIFSILDK